MNFENFKNDTARANSARDYLASVIEKALINELGEKNVIAVNEKIYLENGSEIPPHTICACIGQTKNKDGFLVDVVATITPKIKKWNTTVGKSRTTHAVSFDDILELITPDEDDGENEGE